MTKEEIAVLSKRLLNAMEAVQVFEPGIHSEVDEWTYHHSEGVSKSDLDYLHPTPAARFSSIEPAVDIFAIWHQRFEFIKKRRATVKSHNRWR